MFQHCGHHSCCRGSASAGRSAAAAAAVNIASRAWICRHNLHLLIRCIVSLLRLTPLQFCMQLSMSYKVHSCNTVVIAKRCSGMYKKGLYLFREYSAGYRARLLACSHIPCLFILLSDFVAVRVLYQCVYGDMLSSCSWLAFPAVTCICTRL